MIFMQQIIEYLERNLRENIIGLALVSLSKKYFGGLAVSEGSSMLRKLTVNIDDDKDLQVVVVSKALLIGDAYYDIVGNYIVTHLLFPLEITYDKEKLLSKIVVDTRKKIIDEEVSILASYGKILSYAIIPLEYFPIKALSIRIRLYDSLGKLATRIIEYMGFSKFKETLRETYREIIQSIIEGNRLKIIDEYHVRLSNEVLLEPSYKKYIPRIKEKISPIAMSVASFLMDERPQHDLYLKLPIEFLKPHLMIKMREGVLGLGDWRELLEKKYGVLEKEGRTSIVHATEIYRAGGRRLVVKEYTSPSSIKWILASIASILSKKFIVNSWERQYNEYHASILLSSKGFPHRRILVVDPISAVTVFEYIEGKTLVELSKNMDRTTETAYKLTGRLLGELHVNNIVMGDTKPDNYILTNSREGPMIVPVDLEQTRETSSVEEKAWDIAMFTYFHGVGHARIPSRYIGLIQLFLKEYASIVGDSRIIVEAGKMKYQLPFMYVVPVHNLIQLNSVLRSFAKSLVD